MKSTTRLTGVALLSLLAIAGASHAQGKVSPRGAFADMNPQVSCEHAGTHGKQ